MISLWYYAGSICQAPNTISERRANMSLTGKIFMIAVALSLTVGIYGCKKEGPAERAGEKIDEAIDKAKDKVDEATK